VKLIKQVRLEFRQGTSDKVYEVDLCEVGPGQYVVNYRYGRRGTTLRDGSRTASPVPLATAQSIFGKLIQSKRNEGYVDFGTTAAPPAAPAARPPAPPPSPPAAPAPGVVRQARLEQRRGTTHKVYEIDLVEVRPNRFRVVVRQGRRGAALHEDIETPAPLPRAAAEPIFEDLVAARLREGYVDVTGGAAPAAATPPEEPVLDALPAEGRDGAVLDRLIEGFDGGGRPASGKGSWRLSRAIWRAGELGLGAAEPILLDLLEQTRRRKAEREGRPGRDRFNRDEFERLLGNSLRMPRHRWAFTRWPASFAPPEDLFLYVLAWSLARCGSAASVPALQTLRTESWEPVGRVATAALLLLLTDRQRAALVEELTDQLPASLAGLCRTGPADAFRQALQEYLARADALPGPVLDYLYLIDNPHVRPALLEVLRTAALDSAYFQAVRHVFKVAELRRDAEVFGLLAHRFETTPTGSGRHRVQLPHVQYHQGQRQHVEQSVAPFGKKTRRYFRFRCWRTLRRLGDLRDADYVRLAVGVLLAFTDADGHEPESWSEVEYEPTRWGRRVSRTHRRYRDRFGRYWAFNQILYRNSPRYGAMERQGTFACKDPYRPGNPEPPVREEAFPRLWEAAPEALLRLLTESRCEPVHGFGVKALRACPDYCRRLPVPDLARLFEASYDVTLRFALELAVQRYDPARPDHDLVLALANCGLALARRGAQQWIDAQRDHFTQDLGFLAALTASPQAETRTYARTLLQQTTFTPAAAEALVGRLVALLRSFGAGDGERARDTGQTLLLVFADPLRRLGETVIRDLVEHPLPEVRQFAGELLLAHAGLAGRPPEQILLRLLQDSDVSVRAVGVRLLGQLPEGMLKENLDLLVGLTRHELPDFRQNVRPLIKRLADADPAFGRSIARRLAEALLVPGAPEGVPSHTARVLREDLRPYLGDIPAATIWKLLQSRSPPAQEVGGVLLASNVRPEDLSLAEIVKLASHDILAVREAAWQMCRASLDRLKADMDTASRLVDAKWQDSRQFAFGLLRDAFGRGELTPAILVSLCDSVRPDVQQFGREMITRLFEDQDGPELAIKLSEHPSTSMQMFTAAFLERYAGSDPDRLRELTWYFRSVLSRVNQGRVARERVFAFLEKVAGVSEGCAAVVAEILARQSATAAVGDRARAVAIMTRIHAAYPAVAMPLRVRPVEVRNGV
jgi:predicted DNA-binding WGR domain protein